MKLISKIASVLAVVTLTLVSCNKEGNGDVNTAELDATLAQCEAVLKAATTEEYPQEAIATFEGVVNSAKSAIAKGLESQTKADNLNKQLLEALKAFEAKAYGAIPESAVLCALSFEKIENNAFKTTGAKAWDAVLTEGPKAVFPNTGVPTLVDGKKGKAVHFTKGSHLEIAGVTAKDFDLNEMSIATWIKVDATRTNNVICSFNWWNTFKLSVQDGGKPFITIKTENACTDMDNEHDQSVNPETGWTHVCIAWSGKSGVLSMYVNGELTKEWNTDSKGDALKGKLVFPETLQPFIIGQFAPNAELATWDWAGNETNWGSLEGALDEFAVYNVCLTAGQVARLAK